MSWPRALFSRILDAGITVVVAAGGLVLLFAAFTHVIRPIAIEPVAVTAAAPPAAAIRPDRRATTPAAVLRPHVVANAVALHRSAGATRLSHVSGRGLTPAAHRSSKSPTVRQAGARKGIFKPKAVAVFPRLRAATLAGVPAATAPVRTSPRTPATAVAFVRAAATVPARPEAQFPGRAPASVGGAPVRATATHRLTEHVAIPGTLGRIPATHVALAGSRNAAKAARHGYRGRHAPRAGALATPEPPVAFDARPELVGAAANAIAGDGAAIDGLRVRGRVIATPPPVPAISEP